MSAQPLSSCVNRPQTFPQDISPYLGKPISELPSVHSPNPEANPLDLKVKYVVDDNLMHLKELQKKYPKRIYYIPSNLLMMAQYIAMPSPSLDICSSENHTVCQIVGTPYVRKGRSITEGSVDENRLLSHEISILASMKPHPNIIEFVGVDLLNRIVLKNGEQNLSALAEHTQLSHHEICEIAHSLLQGLKHLLHHHIVHRDLKSSNITTMNDGKRQYRICDFGFSHILTSEELQIPPIMKWSGTFVYRAPEDCDITWDKDTKVKIQPLQEPFRYVTIAQTSDLWAFGILIYKLYQKHHLLEKNGVTDQEIYNQICTQFIMVPQKIRTVCKSTPTDTSSEKKIKYLIDSCLKFNPSQRPSVETLLQEFSTLTVKDIKK